MNTRLARASMALVASMALIVACGGGSDDSSGEPVATDASIATDAPVGVDSGATDDTTSPDTTESSGGVGSPGDFEPGDIGYRVVNALDEPVDIYVRTSGLVEAFTIAEGVEPFAVTDLAAPPAGGQYVVTEAGAGNPTCVMECDHFIAELTAFGDDGPVHTVLLYNEETGEPAAFDLWEQPEPGNEANANAMAPADPANGVVVVTAIALTDADFGLRLGIAGTPGCLEPFNLDNVLVGGNQTPAFTYDGDRVDLVVHDNSDRECTEAPVGGTFTVDGGPGTRSHLILTGTPNDMSAIVVPMIDDDSATTSSGDEGATSDGDRDVAIEQMAIEAAANLRLDDTRTPSGLASARMS